MKHIKYFQSYENYFLLSDISIEFIKGLFFIVNMVKLHLIIYHQINILKCTCILIVPDNYLLCILKCFCKGSYVES